MPLPASDLSVISAVAPSAAQDGSQIVVTWTVRNNGPDAAAGTWVDRIALVNTSNASDRHELGTFVRSIGLGAGNTYSRTESLALPHVQGVFRIEVVTDSGNAVNDGNRFNNLQISDLLTVSLYPRPDLQVTSLTVPDRVTAGTVIDVVFRVGNFGAVPTPSGGSRWTDQVYLSANATFDVGDVLLGEVENGSALGVGQSYQTTRTFTLPRAFGGNAFVIIFADGRANVDEFPQEANNTLAQPIAIDVTPVPPPDLVLTSLAGPLQAFDGNSITVRYTVENRGTGVTAPDSWTDQLWLTLGKDRPNTMRGDILLGGAGHSGALEVGGSYDGSITVTLPRFITGQYQLTVWTNANSNVYETALSSNVNPDAPNDIQGNNFKATPFTVFLTPPSDLEVTDARAPPLAQGAQTVTISWTVENKGAVTTNRDRWADAIWLSTDNDLNDGLGQQWLVFAAPHVGALAKNESYSETATFTLPPSAFGSHFIVQTNADPRLAAPGDNLFLDQIKGILQRFEQALGKPLADVSISSIPNFSASDVINILTGGNQATLDLVYEGGLTANNYRAAASTVTNGPADLVVSSVTAPASSASGEVIQVGYTVLNQGADVYAGTRLWRDFIFVSPDPTYIASRAALLGVVLHDNSTGLAAGGSYNGQFDVTLPEGISGTFYLHVFTDIGLNRYGQANTGGLSPGSYAGWPQAFAERVWEGLGDKSNNYGNTSLQVVLREPDLRVTSLNVAATASSGGTVPISFTATNTGLRATRVDQWTDRVYLSLDGSLDAYDVLLGNFTHNGVLQPGTGYTVNGSVRLPDNISGNFQLLVYIDSPFASALVGTTVYPYPIAAGNQRIALGANPMGAVHEFQNEANDITARTLTVAPAPAPDLQVTVVTVPQSVFANQDFTVTYTVRNSGPGNVPDRQNAWTDQVYLSRDQFLDVRSDLFISEVRHTGVVLSGNSYTVTQTFTLPRGVVAPYYVFVLADAPGSFNPVGGVQESSETNNATHSATPMLVQLPPPSDLQVTQVISPPSGKVGDTLTFSWTVTNKGTSPAAGRWTDAVYLSTDATWDYGDILVGTVNHASGTLTANQGYSAQLTALLPPMLPGLYRAIVRTDVFDDIYEAQFNANNATAASDTLAVTVNPLLIGTPATGQIRKDGSLLYRVNVPAGQTLQVKAVGASGALSLELYASHQALPNSIAADASFEGALGSSQSLLVPTTQAGDYFVLVRAASAPPGQTNVTVTATLLPFGITDVTPDAVGDSRYATITIRGAMFSQQAAVKLIRPTFAEFAPASYQVINATKIIATFDLRGAPNGLYDVQVTNPDGAVAIVPYRLQVDGAQQPDTPIGLGGPSTIEIGGTGIYAVTLQNGANLNTPYVHVVFGVPRVENQSGGFIPGEAVTYNATLGGSASVNGVPWTGLDSTLNLNGRFISSGFAADLVTGGVGGLTFTVRAYAGIDEVLRQDPRFFESLLPGQLESLSFNMWIMAAATPMTTAEYIAYQTGQAGRLRAAILADPAAPQSLLNLANSSSTWDSAYLAALTQVGLLLAEDAPPPVHESAQFTSSLVTLLAGALGGPGGSAIIAANPLPDDWTGFFTRFRGWMGDTPNAYGSGGVLPQASEFDLHLTSQTQFITYKVRVGTPGQESTVTPTDPNFSDIFGLSGQFSRRVQLTGPNGAGAANFVPANTPLPYVIGFSQESSASSALKQLQVVQQLSPLLDVRTFELSDVQLGTLKLDFPSGRGGFTSEYDFTQSRGFVLQVNAGIDLTTNTATWLFRAIDPVTGQLVTDPNLGFLRAGEKASFGYSVETAETVVTGDRIITSVRAIADSGTPMDSNAVMSVIDATAPTTTFTATPAGSGKYQLVWQAGDDANGSGFADSTVYVAVNQGPFVALLRNTTLNSYLFTGDSAKSYQFLVLSADVAGNAEAAPSGVLAPPYSPNINLGPLPDVTGTPTDQLPTAAPPLSSTPVNAAFIEALLGVPGVGSATRPASFSRVLQPFTLGAFASGMDTSGAGIGPLGIAFSPDGQTVYITGGPGRSTLWKLGLAGGLATPATALTTLTVPIYDLVTDASGQLWATTGGLGLVHLDTGTGAVLESFGAGEALGLAAAPGGTKLYVATTAGVQIFDTQTHAFSAFSRTRVDGIAVAPDGTVWGTRWPRGGELIKFDDRGRASIVMTFDDRANGLAFGQDGTPLAGLLFVSHATGGHVTMIDVASMRTLQVATGGTRSEFIKIGPDGRLYITQSGQIDVLQPVTPPLIIATNPVRGSGALPPARQITLTFDQDMKTSGAGSVVDFSNYLLVSTAGGGALPIGSAAYNILSRTVTLTFSPLLPGAYKLTVAPELQSATSVKMASAYVLDFTALEEVIAVQPNFSNTRLNHTSGTVSVDISVINSVGFDIAAPVRVVFRGLAGRTDVRLLNADGIAGDGSPYVNLMAPGGAMLLLNGASTVTRTLTVSDPTFASFDFNPLVLVTAPPNVPPVFTTTPGGQAAVGVTFTYASHAVDPDGAQITYLLTRGPQGATINALTGALTWTPRAGDGPSVFFEIRAYDSRGGFAQQDWLVTSTGGNVAPTLAPIGTRTLAEGQQLIVPVSAFDPDSATLIYWADRLPPGASFDAHLNAIVWTPDGNSAGRYDGVTAVVSDGVNERTTAFTIIVTDTPQAPVITPPLARTILEGDHLSIPIEATLSGGGTILWDAPLLPPGAHLDPNTGVFTWTPRYDQHGTYAVDIYAVNGSAVSRSVLNLTVLNVNGAVKFVTLPAFSIFEGQAVNVRVAANDPEYPAFNAAALGSSDDGDIENGNFLPPLTITHSTLPSGAAWDGTKLLFSWTPTSTQAGIYTIDFIVTDDGDGTGAPTTRHRAFRHQRRGSQSNTHRDDAAESEHRHRSGPDNSGGGGRSRGTSADAERGRLADVCDLHGQRERHRPDLGGFAPGGPGRLRVDGDRDR